MEGRKEWANDRVKRTPWTAVTTHSKNVSANRDLIVAKRSSEEKEDQGDDDTVRWGGSSRKWHPHMRLGWNYGNNYKQHKLVPMPFYFQCNKIPTTLLGAAAQAELWRRKALQLLLLLLLILNVDDGGLFAAAHELLPYRGLNGSGLIHPLSSTHSLLVLLPPASWQSWWPTQTSWYSPFKWTPDYLGGGAGAGGVGCIRKLSGAISDNPHQFDGWS